MTKTNIHKLKKLNFFEWNNKVLVSSLKKIDLNIILIIFLDILFYSISGFMIVIWLQRIQTKMLGFVLPADIMALGYEKAQQLLNNARTFYLLIIFSFILLLIAIIFFASIFKGIIWAKTTNTKITIRLLSKFLGLNLFWMGFWFMAVILISLLVTPTASPLFMVAAIIIGTYFTNTLYTIFMREQKFKSIINAIKLNAAKVHLFLLPYAVILLLYYIFTRTVIWLNFRYSTIAFVLIAIAFAAVVRFYISNLVTEIERH